MAQHFPSCGLPCFPGQIIRIYPACASAYASSSRSRR
nr:MAG TPA: LINALOOL DEHYDRATASE/ISOMERASE [Caudoviricetes sp.]